MANYVVSKETWYDEDKQLYYKYIGSDDSINTLMYTAWGDTEYIADLKAKLVVSLLNKLSIGKDFILSEINNQSVMHVGDKLTAINECIMHDDGRSTLTKGRTYRVVDIYEVKMEFCVIDDEGDHHWFPIEESDMYFTKNQ